MHPSRLIIKKFPVNQFIWKLFLSLIFTPLALFAENGSQPRFDPLGILKTTMPGKSTDSYFSKKTRALLNRIAHPRKKTQGRPHNNMCDRFHQAVTKEKQYLLELENARKAYRRKSKKIRSTGTLDQETLSLFEVPEFHPNEFGLDSNGVEFETMALTQSYLKAIKEQFSILNVNIVSHTETTTQRIPLHDAAHLFDPNASQAFDFHNWYTLFIDKMPDLQYEQRIEIMKMKTFEKLESLRSQLLHSVVEAMKLEGTQIRSTEEKILRIKDEIKKTIENVPGNSQKARIQFINDLAQSPAYNEDVKQLLSELKFQTDYAQAVVNENPVSEIKALYFFYLLGNYFENIPNSRYILWSKMWNSHIKQGSGEVRFYISDRQEFIQSVFGDHLPISIVKNFQALSPSQAVWARSQVHRFLGYNLNLLNSKLQQRVLVAADFVRVNVPQGNGTRPTPYTPELFNESVSITLESGDKITTSNLIGIWSLPQSHGRIPYGIRQLKTKNTNIDIDGDRRQMSVQTHLPNGGYATESRTFVYNPYSPCGARRPESFSIGSNVRFTAIDDIPMITSIILDLSDDGLSLLK